MVLLATEKLRVEVVIAALIIILSGALTIEEAYESVNWRTLFLAAGMLTLGLAMEETGTAQFLADIMLGSFGSCNCEDQLAWSN